jgi:hypothetical protein
LDRKEAMALLKRLVDNDLIEPSFVSIVEAKTNYYQIQIKCDFNKAQIEAYAEKNGLKIAEDNKRKYLVIFKPYFCPLRTPIFKRQALNSSPKQSLLAHERDIFF